MLEGEILNLLLVLLAAWGGGILANRLGYPAILGELIAGILFGPALIGLLHESELVSSVADIGILLLMMYIGMEIDFNDLKKASLWGFVSAIGSFIVPFFLGYYTIILFGGSSLSGLLTGLAVGVTSLATKSRILLDLKLLNTRIATMLMSGALISDTLALIVFAGIISINDLGSVQLIPLLWVALKAIMFFAITISMGIYLFPLLGKLLDRFRLSNRTFSFTLLLIICFLYAELAELMGMHGILGAFIAGLFVREGVFNRQLNREVNKVFYDISIGFLAPIFFVSSGFNVDLAVFSTNTLLLVTIISLAIVGKILGTLLFYLPSGYGWREGLTIGAGMNGRGAVEIIIAGIGLQLGMISKDIFSILVFMAILTTLTVPFLLTWTTNWLRRRGELVEYEKRKGYLFVGINSLSLLMARELSTFAPVVMIDSNEEMAERARKEALTVVMGNALNDDVLIKANVPKMKTIISMTRNSEINILAAQLAHETYSVPEKMVLLSPGKEGAGINLLTPMGASTIFGMKTDLLFWNNRIDSGIITRMEWDIEKGKASQWIKNEKKRDLSFLPVFIKGVDGQLRPFHYDETFASGEKVILLTPES
ncbi:MAG TPA: cation:proton antiporter [Prolixibacteraceae bacterium]|nr:cation:proton antiporter [Prolixibacteraceae bacterium]